MTITDTQRQAILVLKVGDTADGLLAANVVALWESYADVAVASPRLRELYVHRDLISIARAAIRHQVNFSAGGTNAIKIDAHQRVETLDRMVKDLYYQLQQEERVARHNRPPALGTLTQTAPELPADGLAAPAPFDPNDPAYAGSPFRPLARP